MAGLEALLLMQYSSSHERTSIDHSIGFSEFTDLRWSTARPISKIAALTGKCSYSVFSCKAPFPVSSAAEPNIS